VTLFFGFLLTFVLFGCSIAEQDATDVGNQFQQGLQGRGKIVPRDPLADSFGPDYR